MVTRRSDLDRGPDADGSDSEMTLEHCEACEESTPHHVRLELRTESEGDHTGFSREPYRIAVCDVCGRTEAGRANPG